jgi:hypothetical protein
VTSVWHELPREAEIEPSLYAAESIFDETDVAGPYVELASELERARLLTP